MNLLACLIFITLTLTEICCYLNYGISSWSSDELTSNNLSRLMIISFKEDKLKTNQILNCIDPIAILINVFLLIKSHISFELARIPNELDATH